MIWGNSKERFEGFGKIRNGEKRLILWKDFWKSWDFIENSRGKGKYLLKRESKGRNENVKWV